MCTPSWDTDAGYKMYLDGQSDKEISKALHIAVSTVAYRRRKYWEQIPQAGGGGVCRPDYLCRRGGKAYAYS